MGSKRPYPGEGAPPAARHQKSGNPHSSEYPRSAKKKRKAPKHTTTTTTTTTDQGSKTSFTNVRHRARAIRRLLDKDGGLPANVRNDLERELAAHKATIGERDMQRNRSKMISRYHMVRFFERQKAERMVKRVKNQIRAAATGTAGDQAGELECLKNDLHIAEVDVAYTKYFPFLEKYVSLYPSHEQPAKTLSQDEKNRFWLNKPRPDMWKVIEVAMENGEAQLERVRDRKDTLARGQGQPSSRATADMNDHQSAEDDEKSENLGMSDGEDGGFFEEGV